MIKVFYWAPFISKIATPKAVINSAMSLKKYSNSEIQPTIINLFNEWDNFFKDFKSFGLLKLNIFSRSINLILPDKGYLRSRISYVTIFFLCFLPLLRLLKKEKPEYLIIHLNTSLPLILLLLFKFETKFILRISGKPRLNILRKFLWRLVSKKIYYVTSPTRLIKEELVNNKIFSPQKIMVLYDPIINMKEFRKYNNKRENNKNKMVAIGRLTKQKNFDFLIKCFSKVQIINQDLTLHILGDGDQKKLLTDLIAKMGLQKKVFLVGHKDNIYKYLVNCYCLVLSSLWEDPGFVIVESALSNTLIFSSDCETGPKELLLNEEDSFVFESNSEISFLNTFKKLQLTSEKNKQKMKLKMKKKIKKFTLIEHFRALRKIIL